MKKATALRIKARLDGTPVALAFKTNGNKPPVAFPRHWIPSTMGVADVDRCIEDVRHGRVHTINEIASNLRCSSMTALKIFDRELGVIRVGAALRVPEIVFQRVLHQIMNADTMPDEQSQ